MVRWLVSGGLVKLLNTCRDSEKRLQFIGRKEELGRTPATGHFDPEVMGKMVRLLFRGAAKPGRDVGKGRASSKRPGWLQGWQGAEPAEVLWEDVKGSNTMLTRLLLVLGPGESPPEVFTLSH